MALISEEVQDVPSQADCAKCKIGALTIYAPTFERSPATVCNLRTQVVRLKAHQTIHRAGEVPTRAYTLFKGWACRAVHFPDGRRQILSFLLPGDTIGLENVWVEKFKVTSTVRSLTDVTLCTFQPADLRTIISSSDAQRRAFSHHVQRLLTQAERRLVDIGRRRAVARIARLVLDIHSTLRERGLAGPDELDFPLRQEDIADALGVTTAHVNRTLLSLRRRGVLDIRQGKARLLDLTQLKATGANE
ncbi:MAG TPA: Crp/Fnr family transcriptional regulator [Verrucomicrobiae bacterium]|nr:Crp/Fnr family transcriptional regulator [Verrucomicrobiae bacterium]